MLVIKGLSDIREFFWPLLEDEPKITEPKDVPINHTAIESIDLLYDLAEKQLESEAERRKTIEGKATIFIAVLSIGVTLILSIAKDFINSDITFWKLANILILFALIVYLLRTLWFSLKTIEKGRYQTMDVRDILKDLAPSENLIDTKKAIITEMLKIYHLNAFQINIKVDYMSMAQDYFKRSIVVMGLALVALLFQLLSKPVSLDDLFSANFIQMASLLILFLLIAKYVISILQEIHCFFRNR